MIGLWRTAFNNTYRLILPDSINTIGITIRKLLEKSTWKKI